MGKVFNVDCATVIKITEQDIDDIMVSALEGGITYWCDNATVGEENYYGEYGSEQIARGGTLILHNFEEDTNYTLDREKFLMGVKIAFENGYFREYNWCNGFQLDHMEIDGEVADAIVQCAIFGDAIYG